MTSLHAREPDADRISIIGLGPMGLALADASLARGQVLTVWNRTPEKADDLVARGARRARTVAEAVAASRTTIVCLDSYETLQRVFGPEIDAAAGGTVINLTSGTPNEARAAEAWFAEQGLDYLDGAIMVPPPAVGTPEAVLLYSGARDVFDRHVGALASFGDPRYLGEDVGLAVLHNSALLEMMYATINGWLHATALLDSANVSAQTFSELALGWFMPAVVDPASLAEQAPALDDAEYPGGLGTLAMNLNALEHIVRTSEEQGVHPDQPRALKRIAEQAVAAGYGAQNYFAVYELFKNTR